MSDEQTSFKVTDRRLFNPDGSPRELTPEEKQELASGIAGAAPESTEVQPPVSRAEDRAPSPQQRASARPEPEAPPEIDPEDARDPASFVNFLMTIASNAASALGMMEHPVTHERDLDLEVAKHWIDVLGMLQRKTEGNLNPKEHQILDGILSDLRMQYVSLTNSPQSKGARPYTGRDIIGGK